MKIVGIKDVTEVKSKKSGKELNAYMVWVVGPGHDVVGQESQMLFVDTELFITAADGRELEELIDCDCDANYDRRGFMTGFTIEA